MNCIGSMLLSQESLYQYEPHRVLLKTGWLSLAAWPTVPVGNNMHVPEFQAERFCQTEQPPVIDTVNPFRSCAASSL